MRRIVIVPALLALWAQPTIADDWVHYEESYRYEAGPNADYRVYETLPAYREPDDDDLSYGYVNSGEPPPRAYGHSTECEVEREWDDGHYRETVECEED